MVKYKEIDQVEIAHFLKGGLILIVTATDVESNTTHQKLKPLLGHDSILKVFIGDHTYYLGVLGVYNIVHVQCSMGSISRDSSIMTVTNALNATKTKVVVMVGIAFGVDEEKQQIGDVLLSESIIPYNLKRVGKKKTIQRGIEAPSSKILLNRFKNIKTTWQHFLPNGNQPKLITTRLLSGEELVDNLTHRNKLIKANPESKGGEMEGAGVYAACDGKADWIIIKGICDFADGDKGIGKGEKQQIAIDSAISACLEIFNSPAAFKEMGILPILEEDELPPQPDNLNQVLFDVYDVAKERYYIERTNDQIFGSTLSQLGMWISGPPGCGKSNLILRNLIFSKKPFIQVSLASCIGLNMDSFFKEILFELVALTKSYEQQINPKDFSETNKLILDLLNKHFNGKELVVFIEEIPISTDDAYKDFSGKLFSLLISKNFVPGLEQVRFVLSSINSPVSHIQIFQQKIYQQLKFIQMEYWDDTDMLKLVSTVEQELNLPLPQTIRNSLLAAAKGSPRFIKKFFRSIYILNKKDEKTLEFLIAETKRELN